MKGFKEFLLRGSVVDLAVAVVIGGASGVIAARRCAFCAQPLEAARRAIA